jgi:MoaA/NifB/PqqE/SkfB family radical SAM enzyme
MPYGSLYFKKLEEEFLKSGYADKAYLPNHVGTSVRQIYPNEQYYDEVFKKTRYNELTDENRKSKRYEHEYTGKRVIIMICSKCNVNCKHCYVSYNGNRKPEELIELVTTLKDKYEIELNGAEVLTDLEYLKAFKIVGQHFLLSNGKAIIDNPKTIDALKENDIESVSLSYHFGVQDDFSEITEEKLNTIIAELQKNGIDVRLMTTITSKNYDKIEEMCKRASDLGVKGIKFTNLVAQGKHFDLYNQLLNDDEKTKFFEQLSKVREEYDKDTLIIERCGTFGKNLCISKSNFECICGRDQVVLTPNDRLYPCVFLARTGYEMGELVDGKLMVGENFDVKTDNCLVDEVCNKTLIYKRREVE